MTYASMVRFWHLLNSRNASLWNSPFSCWKSTSYGPLRCLEGLWVWGLGVGRRVGCSQEGWWFVFYWSNQRRYDWEDGVCRVGWKSPEKFKIFASSQSFFFDESVTKETSKSLKCFNRFPTLMYYPCILPWILPWNVTRHTNSSLHPTIITFESTFLSAQNVFKINKRRTNTIAVRTCAQHENVWNENCGYIAFE